MAKKINMISANGNQTITQAISNVNDNVADSDIALFVVGLAGLSNNTLKKIEKLEIATIQTNYSIVGSDDGETITCDDFEVTIDAAGGNDLISLGANAENCTIYAGDGYNTIYGNDGAHVYGHWGLAHDTILGFTESDSLLISSAQDFTPALDSDGAIVIVSPTTNLYIKGQKRLNATGNTPADFNGFSQLPDLNITRVGESSIQTNKTAEEISITAGNSMFYEVRYKDIGKQSWSEILLAAAGATIDSNARDDSIYVGENVRGLNLKGGKGKDKFYFDETAGRAGNAVVYTRNDSQDSIYGWNDNDSLILAFDSDNSISLCANSADGNDFILSFRDNRLETEATPSHWVTFKNIEPDTAINVFNDSGTRLISDDEINYSTPYHKKKIMLGSTANNTFNNFYSDNNGVKILPKSGVNSDTAWTIIGGEGNDKITNEGSFVSISGGAGNDTIFVQAYGTKHNSTVASDDLKITPSVTSGVTIYGGAGNDSINLESDTAEVGGVITRGAHVLQFDSNSGNNTIKGYNSNDTIQILDNSAVLYQGLSLGSYADCFVFSVGDSAMISVAMDGLTDGATLKIIDSDAKVTASDVTIPRIIKCDNNDNEIFNSESGVYILALNGADSITNSGSNVTILAGYGADSIQNSGANIVYQFANSNGNNTIQGFTDSDTIYFSTIDSLNSSLFGAASINADGSAVTVKGGGGNSTTINAYGAAGTFANGFKIIYQGHTNSAVTYPYFYKNIAANTVYEKPVGDIYNALYAGGGNTITASDDYVSIGTGNTANSISATGNYTKIIANSGNDTITVGGANSSVYSSVGDDIIVLTGNAANCTVNAYTGNDSIVSNGQGNVFYFRANSNDGTDTISGFSDNDHICVYPTTTTVTSAVVDEDTSITLQSGSYSTYVILQNKVASTVKFYLYNSDTEKIHQVGTTSTGDTGWI
ncbi:MAG: hypothetical protein IJT73_00605 [Selenomonadaceae bacterium]|nr:hypothetical protein [Selenomonadaceae bacterium]